MKKRRRKNTVLTHEGAVLKSRVTKTRFRARFVGIIYTIAIVVLALAACLPFFDLGKQPNAPVGLTAFSKVFAPATWKTLGLRSITNAVLYGVLLLVLFINVLRAMSKMSWLFKQKVSKTYGLNRNVYAMEDLGKIFSGSYAMILVTYFLMTIVGGAAYFNALMYIVIGFGLFVHLFAGFIGGKASYFKMEGCRIVEDARDVSRFPALFRNVLQLIAVFAMMVYFEKVSVLDTFARPLLLEKGGIQNYVAGQPLAYLSIVLQALCVVCFIPLIFHATGTTEYNIDGAYGSGMKTFRVFAFLVFLAMGAAVASQYVIGQATLAVVDGAKVVEVVKALDMDVLYIAGIALVMFIVEIIMRNMPGYKDDSKENNCNCNCSSSNNSNNPAVVLHIYNN